MMIIFPDGTIELQPIRQRTARGTWLCVALLLLGLLALLVV